MLGTITKINVKYGKNIRKKIRICNRGSTKHTQMLKKELPPVLLPVLPPIYSLELDSLVILQNILKNKIEEQLIISQDIANSQAKLSGDCKKQMLVNTNINHKQIILSNNIVEQFREKQ